MNNTRDRILQAALSLFGQKGYNAASMSDIANCLGVTKGALYRHFDSKRAILDAILERMRVQDQQQAEDCDVPVDPVESSASAYAQTRLQDIRAFTLEMFRYWTQDPFASAFRRMLALERFHDGEIMVLYQNYLCSGPLKYMEDLFREMSAQGKWKAADASAMALEFFGPMSLLMDVSDSLQDKAEAERRLAEYADRFIEKYTC